MNETEFRRGLPPDQARLRALASLTLAVRRETEGIEVELPGYAPEQAVAVLEAARVLTAATATLSRVVDRVVRIAPPLDEPEPGEEH